jgi:hypothetical protein
MPQVFDLTAINKTVQDSMPVVKAAVTGLSDNPASNDFAWIDRIVNLLDKVTQFAGTYKSMSAPVQAQAIEQTREQNQPLEYRAVPVKSQAPPLNNEDKEKQKMLTNMIIKVFETHLEKCIKENPSMPIGEAISKLDFINVCEAKELIQGMKK